MDFWTMDNFRGVLAGRWLCRPGADASDNHLHGLSTDTRSLQPGQVFCALHGANFDGHDFLQQAADAGATLLLVDRPDAADRLQGPRPAVLLVDDTLRALTRLAGAYRRRFSAKVIAVTGSVGKTTTKHMIHSVLATQHRGKASPKSFNNHIGVPLTLLSVEPGDRYIVVEVGTNAPGEINTLARLAEPDIAVITHVGHAHLEKLGSLEQVAREKASLLTHLKPDGLAVVNADIPELARHLRVAPSVISFGRSEEADLRLTDCQTQADHLLFQVNDRWGFQLPMLGAHNAINALAAIAVGRAMKLSDAQIREGLAHASRPDMRLDVQTLGSPAQWTVINDAYNANPDSMAAALQVLRDFPNSGRRVAVLGDMAELGDQSAELHRQLGRNTAESQLDMVIFVGAQSSQYAAETARKLRPEMNILTFPTWSDQLPEQLHDRLQAGDTVLLKASRIMGLERLLPALRQHLEQEQTTAKEAPQPRMIHPSRRVQSIQ